MSAVALLADLHRRGVKVVAEGQSLRCRGPRGALTPGDLTELKARKAEILEALHSEPLPIDQLEADWQAALGRARAGFAAHSVTPTEPSLKAAAALELWLAEGWTAGSGRAWGATASSGLHAGSRRTRLAGCSRPSTTAQQPGSRAMAA